MDRRCGITVVRYNCVSKFGDRGYDHCRSRYDSRIGGVVFGYQCVRLGLDRSLAAHLANT